MRFVWTYLLVLVFAVVLPAADTPKPDVVFRSDVSLVRVDAQVVDRNNRTITGLRQDDFILLEDGKRQEIRNFARENMPVDILLLFDVSRSMRPHVERVTSAADQALQVLGRDDRVAIMVFDRRTRIRMGFRGDRQAVRSGLDALLREEDFEGGTDITRALLDASAYIGREGRRDARRAIVILTDDQTERRRDVEGVSRALTDSDAVLSALLAPDMMRGGMRRHDDGDVNYPPDRRDRGTWPGRSGGGLGGPLGGIILGRGGRRGPMGGPGGGGRMGSHTQSAGTAEIARRSGGDSMQVDDADALETTLSRIRQRYALHFYLPQNVRAGEERQVEVQLTEAARRRYPEAEVRFRRTYMAPDGPVVASNRGSVPQNGSAPASASDSQKDGGWRHVDGSRDSGGPMILTRDSAASAPSSTPAAASPADQPTSQPEQKGGWRKLKPGEQP